LEYANFLEVLFKDCFMKSNYMKALIYE